MATELIERVRERGPLTVAAFMDLALYDPAFGYYACASRRSGAAGDFVTSVDAGPLFGRLLAEQVADMATHLGREAPLTLLDAGAGDGRLCRDLAVALRRMPAVAEPTRLHLVERSAAARSAQRELLAAAGVRDVTSSEALPPSFTGVLVANELLDAMPAHRVVMRDDGLRELYVDATGAALTTREGAVSSPGVAAQLAASGVTLARGAYADVPMAAVQWTRDAARALAHGFMVLIDYGSEAWALYGPTRANGTLSSFRRHCVSDAGSEGWLHDPGDRDITVDVDFTAVRRAAESEGCELLGFMDQTYFLMALAAPLLDSMDDRDTRAFKTLVMPGGLGSTMKVMVLGKGVGRPALRGTSGPARLT